MCSRCRTCDSIPRPAESGGRGREIVLSRKEFDLVHALISQAGDIVTRDELMRDVWDTTFWTSSKTIDVHLGWVRRKLGDDSRRPDADHHDPRQGPAVRDRATATTAHRAAEPSRLASARVPAPAPTLAVIGGGQLARMMAQPAIALGLPLRLLAEAEGVSAAQVIPDHVVGDYRDLDTLREGRPTAARS